MQYLQIYYPLSWTKYFYIFQFRGMFGSTDFSQQSMWPLILAVFWGILFALIFTILTITIMWKTKCYRKLSFYSGKLEEEKEKATASAHVSRQQSATTWYSGKWSRSIYLKFIVHILIFSTKTMENTFEIYSGFAKVASELICKK